MPWKDAVGPLYPLEEGPPSFQHPIAHSKQDKKLTVVFYVLLESASPTIWFKLEAIGVRLEVYCQNG
jgi:hypothetical protein